ncbi:MAG: hypothetical protein HW421_284 [Ignavibacteria bacterium]|nr:hypothetical protein [Ignavibacteria bacterium]
MMNSLNFENSNKFNQIKINSIKTPDIFNLKLINIGSIFFEIIFLILFIGFGNIYAQSTSRYKQANNWFFGKNAAITFNTPDGSPVPYDSSGMEALEGCSAISDSNGRTLLYSYGPGVYDRTNIVTLNGYDLSGHFSASQSSVIIPRPDVKNIYYVLTQWAIEWPKIMYGLQATQIDMELEDGFGDASIKNQEMIKGTFEKLTAVFHKNKKDVWVLTYKTSTNEYFAFLITKKGISKPVITKGVQIIPIPCTGYLKVSPDGKFIANANSDFTWSDSELFKNGGMKPIPAPMELWNFDDSTGQLSNPITFNYVKDKVIYGVEFSPNSTKLYTSSASGFPPYRIIQYDLYAGNELAIKNSASIIGEQNNKFGGMQVAPDGKIYIAQPNTSYLGIIHRPNQVGKLCYYSEKGIKLGTGNCFYGLPSFNQSYFVENPICEKTAFDYPDFRVIETLHTTKDAVQIDSAIRLTTSTTWSKGGMWHNYPVLVNKTFTTKFKFTLSDPSLRQYTNVIDGADGIAFIIQGDKPDTAGTSGGGMGYDGLKNSLAIEFDTYYNDSLADPSKFHIGVFSNGRNPNSSNHASKANLGTTANIIPLEPNNRTYFAQIDYNVLPNKLRIFLDKTGLFENPALVIDNINLEQLLNLESGTNAYIGLTSATGAYYQTHKIYSWSFCPRKDNIVSEVEESHEPTPLASETSLLVYPNPAYSKVNFIFNIQNYNQASLKIYNSYGQIVSVLPAGQFLSGTNRLTWDCSDIPNGIYFARLSLTSGEVLTRQIVKIK